MSWIQMLLMMMGIRSLAICASIESKQDRWEPEDESDYAIEEMQNEIWALQGDRENDTKLDPVEMFNVLGDCFLKQGIDRETFLDIMCKEERSR